MSYRSHTSLIAVIAFALLLNLGAAHAGPITDLARSDFAALVQSIQNGTYEQNLALVRDAYAESKLPNGGLAEYVYRVATTLVSSDQKIGLAIDFALPSPDLSVRQLGVDLIVSRIIANTVVDPARRPQAIAKLKTSLEQCRQLDHNAYGFAVDASKALMLLGDDSGLDVFLTGQETVRAYAKEDQWTPTSDAARFEQLKTQYETKAAMPNNAIAEDDRIMAAAYELCRVRRTQNKEIKPLNPIIKLDELGRLGVKNAGQP